MNCHITRIKKYCKNGSKTKNLILLLEFLTFTIKNEHLFVFNIIPHNCFCNTFCLFDNWRLDLKRRTRKQHSFFNSRIKSDWSDNEQNRKLHYETLFKWKTLGSAKKCKNAKMQKCKNTNDKNANAKYENNINKVQKQETITSK